MVGSNACDTKWRSVRGSGLFFVPGRGPPGDSGWTIGVD